MSSEGFRPSFTDRTEQKCGEKEMLGLGNSLSSQDPPLPPFPSSHMGESMTLAQRLILFGVECLSFQVDLADLWGKGTIGDRILKRETAVCPLPAQQWQKKQIMVLQIQYSISCKALPWHWLPPRSKHCYMALKRSVQQFFSLPQVRF